MAPKPYPCSSGHLLRRAHKVELTMGLLKIIGYSTVGFLFGGPGGALFGAVIGSVAEENSTCNGNELDDEES